MRLKPLNMDEIKVLIGEFGDLLDSYAGIPRDRRRMFRVDQLDWRDVILLKVEFKGDIEGLAFIGLDDVSACIAAEYIHKALTGESKTFERVNEKVKALIMGLGRQYFSGISSSLAKRVDRVCTVSEVDVCDLSETRIIRKYLMVPFTVRSMSQIKLFFNLQAKKKIALTPEEGKWRVVIVDNSLSARDSLEQILEDNQYHVVGEFDNGIDALPKIKELEPHLIIFSLDIPGADGLHIMYSIRAVCPEAKVIIMTGTADKEAILECIKQGASTCILKPFEPPKVIEMVTKTLYFKQ